MNIGVFASMKKGLEQFIYREILYLSSGETTITLCPTKHRPGLYNPPENWNVCRWNTWSVVALQPLLAARLGRRYWSALFLALRFGAISDFFLAAYFCQFIQDVDVLYATFGDRKLFVAYFCKLLVDKPLAVTLHAYELYANPNPRLFRHCLSDCDQVITVSEHNRELLEREYGIPTGQIEIVRYSLDLNEYRPKSRYVVLIVGFFVERKGHEVLFQAIKQLGRDDIEVWVVGGPGAENDVVDVPTLATELGVEESVAFFGTLRGPALKAVYRACDVFCLPCRTQVNGVSEGFPNVLIEAMALGKPIITSRHVEIPRIVKEILVDENDVSGLAAAIEAALSSEAWRKQLGARSRELAELHFSNSNALKTKAILYGLCANATKKESQKGDSGSFRAIVPNETKLPNREF